MPLESCIYRGVVLHRRFAPVPHVFRFPLFLTFLDLDELDTVFAGRWLWSARRPAVVWLRRADHLGDPRIPLRDAVLDRVRERTGIEIDGPVRILTHLRTFGHCFNPLSLYFCYDSAGTGVRAVLAEVTNTPWRERHCYVLAADAGHGTTMRFRNRKEFHVSPFMGMDMEYAWTVTTPGPRLTVHLENHQNGNKIFEATLSLARREITGGALAAALARYPFLTLRVVGRIHAEALRLWLKRVPFHPHPRTARAPDEERA